MMLAPQPIAGAPSARHRSRRLCALSPSRPPPKGRPHVDRTAGNL